MKLIAKTVKLGGKLIAHNLCASVRRTFIAVAVIAIASPAFAAQPEGCRKFQAMRVLDGDTTAGFLHKIDDLWQYVSIRVNGIDTPEKGHRGKCNKERQLGALATKFAEDSLTGNAVCVTDVKKGKYAGRLLGTLHVKQDGKWVNYADLITAKKLAVSYDGGTKPDWCK